MYVINDEKYIFSEKDIQALIDAVRIFNIETVDDLAVWMTNSMNSLNNSKKTYRDIRIAELNLTNRAYNCIMLYLFKNNICSKEADVTVGLVLDNIPSLRCLRGCGIDTAHTIIKCFKCVGADVSVWESETKQWYKTTS